MKTFYKKALFVFIVTTFCLVSLNHVKAVSYDNFGGRVDVNYTVVSKPYKKEDTANWAIVKWTYSDQHSHTMWFKVVDSSGNRMGSSLFEYKETKGFSTTGTYKDSYYRLYAGRENWWDPYTYVSGTWAP